MWLTKRFRIEKGLFFVVFVYIALVLLMLSLREEAYHMDFGYHHAVRDFLKTGILKNHPAVVPSFILQELWGALFSYFMGFSYKTLHFSVIVLFFFGLIAFYKSLRELNVGELKSFVFTVTLLVFPLLFRLIFTFMTNVPHLALETISIYFGILAIKKKSWVCAFNASAFGMFAFLIRNFGLVLPISLLIVFAVNSFYERKLYYKQFLAILLPTVWISSAYYYWLYMGDNITSGQYVFLYKPLHEAQASFFPHSIIAISSYYGKYLAYYHRFAVFGLLLFTILLPLTMMLKIPKWTAIKENKNFLLCSLFAGMVLFTLIYVDLIWTWGIRLEGIYQYIYLPLLGPISWGYVVYRTMPDIYGLGVLINKMLLFFAYATLPLAIFTGGVMVYKTHAYFFKLRNVKSILTNKRLLLAFTLATLFFLSQLNVVIKQNHIFEYVGFFALWAIVLVIFVNFFIFKFTNNLEKDALVILFFTLALISQLFLLMIYDAGWDFEYMFALFPLGILIFAVCFRNVPLSLPRTFIICSMLVVIGVRWAGKDYQYIGLLWETTARYVNAGVVEARNTGGFNWAWFPYFYYEDGYKLALAKNGGNRKIILLHTWREVPQFEPDYNKPLLTVDECDNVDTSKGDVGLGRTHVRNLFINVDYCHILRYEKR